jgi:outer membrane protein OmpA-like peptidoglycan-associated protein
MSIWILLIGSLSAMAGELSFGYSPSLDAGEKPMFSVTVPRAASTLWVVIEAAGESWEFEGADLKAGEEFQVHWPRDEAVVDAQASVRVTFLDGYVEAVVVPIQYSYAGRLSVDLGQAVADLAKRTLTVSVSQPLVRAELKAIGAHGVVLERADIQLQQGPGKVTIPWQGDPSEVVLLDVVLHTANAWSGFTYSPWFVDIPHDDVIFESGESTIRSGEAPKLDSLMVELSDLIDKYGRVVPVQLYIGGCTDTVGTAASNAVLSRARAKEIGGWLKAKGLNIPIFYAGFGERWLAIQTGDGVENALNRRAVYMVSANPPTKSAGVPATRWSRL